MNKDIIYIDTEDDITAIIGKIKASSESIVALVPPKRTGVLQSAVNLRLLARMAKTGDKQLVLITNNKALVALSATAKIPVAKNLQSKPEIAEIAALEIDDGEDIIDGSQLPIGELVKTTDYKQNQDLSDDLSNINIDDEDQTYPAKTSTKPVKSPAKNNVKVPNFSRFRKKFFLGIVAGILLVIFLIWAIWYAPSAKIIIKANTTDAKVSHTVILGGTTATDVTKNTIQSVTKQVKKDASVDFTATGKKTIGDKAKGSVTFQNCDTSSQQTINSGTYISASGKNYIVQSDTLVAAGTFAGGLCTTAGVSAASSVVAADIGSDYNVASGTEFLVSGYTNKMIAISTNGISGGASHDATVVTADDVQKASQALVDLPTTDIKQQLTKLFVNDEIVIPDSFTVDRAAAVSTPAIGEEATSKAKLTSSTTYSLTAIAKSELQPFLKDSITKQISDTKNQRIYNDGIDNVKLAGYLATDKGATVNIEATGQIGPNINNETIKNEAKGKHYGDVQSLIEGIKGVDSVDIKFSYFWVTTVPNDANKIQVEFVISNA
jgi:hypothetical protein